jgi:hypothetical protein
VVFANIAALEAAYIISKNNTKQGAAITYANTDLSEQDQMDCLEGGLAGLRSPWGASGLLALHGVDAISCGAVARSLAWGSCDTAHEHDFGHQADSCNKRNGVQP